MGRRKIRRKSLRNLVSKIGEFSRKLESHVFLDRKMAEFIDDHEPLPSLEDFLVDSVDDLENDWGQGSSIVFIHTSVGFMSTTT